MQLQFSIKKTLIKLLFLTLLFDMCFELINHQSIIYYFVKHVDELITILMYVYILNNCKLLKNIEWKIIGIWLVLTLIGIFSNCIFEYQSIVPVLIDAIIICPRFLVGYMFSIVICRRHKINLINILENTAKIVVTILFLLSIHDIFFSPFFTPGEYRYFTNSLVLMFPHPTYFSSTAVSLLFTLGCKNKKSNYVFMLMASFLCIMTLRIKSIAFVIVYWFIKLFPSLLKKKYFIFFVAAFSVIILTVAKDSIITNFFTPNAFRPRTILSNDSLSLLVKHFPFGTGFGSFASSVAASYYSKLYYLLGYPEFTGMQPNNIIFLNDSFWPIIISQFGFFGTIIFLYVVYLFFKKCFKKMKENKALGIEMLMILIYLMISSVAESSFFNPYALLLFVLFGAIESVGRYDY